MDNDTLKNILARHEQWLNDPTTSEPANLRDANLRYGEKLKLSLLRHVSHAILTPSKRTTGDANAAMKKIALITGATIRCDVRTVTASSNTGRRTCMTCTKKTHEVECPVCNREFLVNTAIIFKYSTDDQEVEIGYEVK